MVTTPEPNWFKIFSDDVGLLAFLAPNLVNNLLDALEEDEPKRPGAWFWPKKAAIVDLRERDGEVNIGTGLKSTFNWEALDS